MIFNLLLFAFLCDILNIYLKENCMAEEKINYMSMVVARKNNNTDNRGNGVGKKFDTTDLVSLLSMDELEETFETDTERRKSNTDFALLNFAWQMSNYKAENSKFTGVFWSRSACDRGYVRSVIRDGSYPYGVSYPTLGAVPALSLNLQSLISARSASAKKIFETKRTVSGKEKHFLKIGEYPKTKASEELQQTLENLFNSGALQAGLTCTGRLFVSNGQKEYQKDFLSKQNPEFEYNGKKYVRTIAWQCDDHKFTWQYDNHKFADGSAVPETGTPVWVEVEPVTFEISNWDRLPKSVNPKGKRFGADKTIDLVAEEAVLSGLPFYPDDDHKNCSMWQNSLQRCFLNSAKSEELDGNPDFESEYKWDFSKSGFLYQALDLTREPTREYVIPEYEKEIADHAFAGCVGIEKIVVHEGVKKVGKDAFAGCNFKFVYKLKGQTSTILSQELPKEEVESLVELGKLTKAFKDFDYGLVLGNSNLESLSKLTDSLNKNKISLPYVFVKQLIDNGMLGSFQDSCDVRFLKSEDGVDLCKNEKYASLTMEEKFDYYKFMLALGCFSKDKVLDKNGKETQVLLAQKATSAFSQILKSGMLKVGDFHGLFDSLPLETKPNQDFLKFISQVGDKKKFSNLELLLNLNKSHPGMFVKVMTNFDRAKSFRTTLNEQGKPTTLSWEDALKKFYASEKYVGVTSETQDIAEVFGGKGLQQSVFEKGVALRQKAKAKGVGEHILGKPLREMTILESIEQIKSETEIILTDSKTLLDELYAKQFTFEMLSKRDPRNAIMGLYASCCGTITSSYYGRHIAEASVTSKDVQNLVVRDSKGEIIAKGTMYVNSQQGYAVFNDFELNQKYREYENDSGRYAVSTDAQKHKEHERDLIFDAIMRGTKAFVKEWDAQHPDNPIQQVNVGMGYNRLKAQCERFKKATRNLSVPSEYSFEDAKSEQHVLYDRKEELKKGGIGR